MDRRPTPPDGRRSPPPDGRRSPPPEGRRTPPGRTSTPPGAGRAAGAAADGDEEPVTVVVRVKPRLGPGPSTVSCNPDGKTLELFSGASWEDRRLYQFSSVFDEHALQHDVYQELARPQLESLFAGKNACIFAYGQTGSGKTHTMHGNAGTEQGLIPRLTNALFSGIDQCRDVVFHVECSFMQIYMDKAYDLLRPGQAKFQDCRLEIREVCGGFQPRGITKCTVRCQRDIDRLLAQGEKTRVKGATAMNAQSSRSHSIFAVHMSQTSVDDLGASHERTSTMFLVDLAGSETVGRTGASGQRLDEARAINGSLSALRGVIMALTKQLVHIPYRDSPLTKVLRDALGGNAKTTVVLNVSAEHLDQPETKSTLDFGQITRTISNHVKPNVHTSTEELRRIWETSQAKLLELREELRRLERQLPGFQGDTAGFNAPADARLTGSALSGAPEHLRCPLKSHLGKDSSPMVCPVVAQDGCTYERSFIEAHWGRYRTLPKPVIDGLPTDRLVIYPNVSLEMQIEEWRAEQQWPSDILALTFSFLSGMEAVRVMWVCRRWCGIAEDELEWASRVTKEFGEEAVAEYSEERDRTWAKFFYRLWIRRRKPDRDSHQWVCCPPTSQRRGLRLFTRR